VPADGVLDELEERAARAVVEPLPRRREERVDERARDRGRDADVSRLRAEGEEIRHLATLQVLDLDELAGGELERDRVGRAHALLETRRRQARDECRGLDGHRALA
jgi:hypothetical protein